FVKPTVAYPARKSGNRPGIGCRQRSTRTHYRWHGDFVMSNFVPVPGAVAIPAGNVGSGLPAAVKGAGAALAVEGIRQYAENTGSQTAIADSVSPVAVPNPNFLNLLGFSAMAWLKLANPDPKPYPATVPIAPNYPK